jgi:flagellar M-ring protein FliF
VPEQLQKIVQNLQAFGPRRLSIMGGVTALVLSIIAVSAIYLNRPAYETLYVGLERSDVNQIGLVLGEAGIGFDVASDGTTVLVPAGQTAAARMLLAEKGLPTSSNAGYELFDNVGSLGLTSFMQEVTRVRALEGEIARTIQSINGIRAARVHLVMSERASFRRVEQAPSASVVIRAGAVDAQKAADSIRHLVAAAVPGLDVARVTVLDASGALLAAGDDFSNSSAARSLGVERTVEMQIEENIRRALAPYLGPDNFRASVKAEVNTDSRQSEETIFDPESRVERSVQVVRAAETSNQRDGATPTSVDQNLPETQATPTAAGESSEQNERKEETTNYEMNTKRVSVVSNGYSVTRMSIAVVVNRDRLAAILGANATPEQIAQRITEIQSVVSSAAGIDEQRGDRLNVSAVEFVDGVGGEMPAVGLMERLDRHLGTLINAGAFLLVVLLVALFGLRPMAAALKKPEEVAALAPPDLGEVQRSLPGADAADPALPGQVYGALPGAQGPSPLDELRQKIRPAPQDRLARMVDLNEERTAQILRKWANPELAA